ncbi:hypothetical protein ACFCX0_21565 [Streptomyces sp. NPDC056352]|uniref:hypothetical protein n=1 Tax=Streptomyces sp. NPDC056352 TaxID=3345791 RepID=UPI0035E37084
MPLPTAPQDTRGWAKALGGVDGGDMLLELSVQGTSQEAVVLHGLHVRVLSRKAPLRHRRVAHRLIRGPDHGARVTVRGH